MISLSSEKFKTPYSLGSPEYPANILPITERYKEDVANEFEVPPLILSEDNQVEQDDFKLKDLTKDLTKKLSMQPNINNEVVSR